MTHVRWEYREIVRTVVVETVEDAVPASGTRIVSPVERTNPRKLPFDRAGLVRMAAPAIAMAALALSRGLSERRHRLAMRTAASLPPSRRPIAALPSGDHLIRSEIDPEVMT